jgi:hypothetical protein
MKASDGINLVKLKLESKNQLLARVWNSIESVLFLVLHTRSRLFMTLLTGQSC